MEIYKQVKTCTPEDTERVGKELAELILEDARMPRFIALEGDLGVGKTVFTRGFVSLLVPGLRCARPPLRSSMNISRRKQSFPSTTLTFIALRTRMSFTRSAFTIISTVEVFV